MRIAWPSPRVPDERGDQRIPQQRSTGRRLELAPAPQGTNRVPPRATPLDVKLDQPPMILPAPPAAQGLASIEVPLWRV